MKNSTFVVTGGTGSWGVELVSQLLNLGAKEVRIFSRNEMRQVEMEQHFADFKDRLCFVIGDIREKDEVIQVCEGADYVFHLAALKHVPICEHQPLEALKTNVTGTQNVIEASIQNKVKKMIYVSTDKVSSPSSTYGMTKAIGEKLTIHANTRETATRFICVRSGNVLGSNGSVVPLFKKQIEKGQEMSVTDFRMTRFFLSIQEAVALLLIAAERGLGGETFVMNMPAVRIIDIADVLIESSGKVGIGIKETGIRAGEKLDEVLFNEEESCRTWQWNDHYYLILPSVHIPGLHSHYKHLELAPISELRSGVKPITKSEVQQMLDRGGFLTFDSCHGMSTGGKGER
ncbi:polysaccharide biosynthesis protein [Paenibacillus sp. Marseille-Q4541]|uniref:polysaccharide biosynthesis protein n=1 Tax=Paenibacillus sp. Marseille-Q4541 TaxID=2831522 RepID=UPI001BAAA106|nr:polysaccharide biosynthesis protein [Paenibacillus sp. Marseille-Q4541]